MAVLNVSEFASIGADIGNKLVPALSHPALAYQQVTGTVSSVASAEFNVKTRMIRIISDADCYVDVAVSPTAASTTMFVASGQQEVLHLQTTGLKIAVID